MSNPISLTRPLPGISIARLNRPERNNALDPVGLDRLLAVLDECDADTSCRVMILTGEGRHFCTGLDMQSFATGSSSGSIGVPDGLLQSMRRTWTRLLPRLRTLRPAVVAAVNGAAIGGGFALALGADIRIAAQGASFQDAFAKVGGSGCELGLGWLLPRMIGFSRAAELMITGRRIDAREAYELGFVHRVHPVEDLLDAAIEKAREIAANPPFAVWMTRNTLWSSQEISSLHAAIDIECRTQALCLMTSDAREQLAARLEKRPPVYGSL